MQFFRHTTGIFKTSSFSRKMKLIAVMVIIMTALTSLPYGAEAFAASSSATDSSESPSAAEQPAASSLSPASAELRLALLGASFSGSGMKTFAIESLKHTLSDNFKAANEKFPAQPKIPPPSEKPEASPAPQTPSGPDPSKPMVALTFDDGPYAPVTDRITARLSQYGARATFFVVGNRVGTYKDSALKALAAGCEIGNHTFDHKASLTKLSYVQIQKQMRDADQAVMYYTGVTPALMRPVGGAHNKTVDSAVGKPLINWSIDTLDWKTKNAASISNAVLKNVKDGDIILMHDLYRTTADACDIIIPELHRRGFQMVTVSELAAAKGKTLQSGTLYTRIR